MAICGEPWFEPRNLHENTAVTPSARLLRSWVDLAYAIYEVTHLR